MVHELEIFVWCKICLELQKFKTKKKFLCKKFRLVPTGNLNTGIDPYSPSECYIMQVKSWNINVMVSQSDRGFSKIIDSVAITGLKMKCAQYASLSQFTSAENDIINGNKATQWKGVRESYTSLSS